MSGLAPAVFASEVCSCSSEQDCSFIPSNAGGGCSVLQTVDFLTGNKLYAKESCAGSNGCASNGCASSYYVDRQGQKLNKASYLSGNFTSFGVPVRLSLARMMARDIRQQICGNQASCPLLDALADPAETQPASLCPGRTPPSMTPRSGAGTGRIARRPRATYATLNDLCVRIADFIQRIEQANCKAAGVCVQTEFLYNPAANSVSNQEFVTQTVLNFYESVNSKACSASSTSAEIAAVVAQNNQLKQQCPAQWLVPVTDLDL
eukprot:766953-Hanusia_phi.AAC.4